MSEIGEDELLSQAKKSLSGYYYHESSCELLFTWLSSLSSTERAFECVSRTLYDYLAKGSVRENLDKAILTPGYDIRPWILPLLEDENWRNFFIRLAASFDNFFLTFILRLIVDNGHADEVTYRVNEVHILRDLEILKAHILVLVKKMSEYHVTNNDFALSRENLAPMVIDLRSYICTRFYLSSLLLRKDVEEFVKHRVGRVLQELERTLESIGLENALAYYSLLFGRNGPFQDVRECDLRVYEASLDFQRTKSWDKLDEIVAALHDLFENEEEEPGLFLLRNSTLIWRMLSDLYVPGSQLDTEQRRRRIHLLALAFETENTGRGEISDAIDISSDICSKNLRGVELRRNVQVMKRYIKFSVVANGVLMWLGEVMTSSEFIGRVSGHKDHFTLINLIVFLHPLCHQDVFEILKKGFLLTQGGYGEGDSEHARHIASSQGPTTLYVKSFVQLVLLGYIDEVLTFFTDAATGNLDKSVTRQFLLDLVQKIEPPFSKDFACRVMGIIEATNVDILRRSLAIRTFIQNCRSL